MGALARTTAVPAAVAIQFGGRSHSRESKPSGVRYRLGSRLRGDDQRFHGDDRPFGGNDVRVEGAPLSEDAATIRS